MKEHVCIVHTSIVVPPFKWSFCSVSASNCLNLNITYTVNGLFAGFAFQSMLIDKAVYPLYSN